jgi:putative transposase
LWIALRYAELNPVRAGLASQAELWPWSSAAAHCGVEADAALETAAWAKRWSAASWREYLERGETEAEIAAIRKCTHTGRPLGTADFLHDLEQATLRCLAPQKGGRVSEVAPNKEQKVLAFETTASPDRNA